MIDFIVSLPFIVGLLLGVIVGAFVGVGLGRRSSGANAFYDRARSKWELETAALKDRIRELEERVKK